MHLSLWLGATRPRTLLLSLGALLPVLALLYTEGRLEVGLGIACVCFMLCLQVATNYANDYADGIAGVDEGRSGRLVATGKVTPKEMRMAFYVLLCVCACLGLAIIAISGLWTLLVGLPLGSLGISRLHRRYRFWLSGVGGSGCLCELWTHRKPRDICNTCGHHR